jgi:valyl-tRNA synthetase
MEEMPRAYEPGDIEKKWYPLWENRGYFHGKPAEGKQPYSVVIPPPNVTGVLHLGHVLNNTLQDILVRWHRMLGHEVSWFPGTDHAGLATERKVERVMLENENITREQLGRDAFISRVWEWRNQYGDTIIKQLRRLGASCDWERERFTMDEGLSYAVRKVFVELYNKGCVYRGRRMINWCPLSKTALSDEEVIHKEVNGKFYHYQYPLSDGSGALVIATTRPETMFGDTAVAVHPDDERYKHLIGKTVDLPLTNRKIPIIADSHADPAKGTGVVKITPSHDPNDYEVGLRHDLPFINVMNLDASMNASAGAEFEGLDRFEARKKAVAMLEELGLMVKIEDIVHAVGYSERGDVPIETLVSEQWFARMDELARPAIKAVQDGEIKFYPERWAKTYFHWMENIKDWCISRQIWWGHRIPAWYHKQTGEIYVGTEAPADIENWRQEEDVLDTWFSSWLWPFSVMGWPEKTPELKFFYPTTDLVTGPDIIFFWVARMIMAGYEFADGLPFKNVYFTSIIRDELGRKLSKSLGNSPDPLDVIDTYGADALRFSIIYIAPIGVDIRYSNEKCEIGRNFANKLWNACRFRRMQGEAVQSFRDLGGIDLNKLTPDEKWILAQINQMTANVNNMLAEYRFDQAVHQIYDVVWSNFCDLFIESAKVRLRAGGEEREQAMAVLDYSIWHILLLLHPFMPFITEELAHQMGYLNDDESIMVSAFPTAAAIPQIPGADEQLLTQVAGKFELASAARNLKASYEIPLGRKVDYYIKAVSPEAAAFLNAELDSLKFLTNAENIAIDTADYDTSQGAAPSILAKTGTIYLPLKGLVDVDAELKKLTEQKKQIEGWIRGSEGKLSNAGFLAKAPEKVVKEAQEHLAELKDKLVRVEDLIKSLG